MYKTTKSNTFAFFNFCDSRTVTKTDFNCIQPTHSKKIIFHEHCMTGLPNNIIFVLHRNSV